MLAKSIRIALPSLLFSSLALLAGCNLFSSFHSDGESTNASVLIADGKAAMARGDYANAMEYFRQAIEVDTPNSEARLGYAEAFLKNQGFSLGALANTLLSQINDNGSGPAPQIINPTDWGCADLDCVADTFATLINVLEPIAAGQTRGPVPQNDIKVNLNVGLVYALRAAVRAQQDPGGTYTLQFYSKDSVTAADLGLLQADFDAIYPSLPSEFWWIDGTPPDALLNTLNQDISNSQARLQTVADQTQSDIINQLIDYVQGLKIQIDVIL